MGLTWSNKTRKEGESKNTAPHNQKNPLELSPVIKCVLQYLNVADLKNCRYISKEWSSTALVQLKTRSKIVFRCRSNRDKKDVSQRTPSRFYEDFSDNLSTPFSAFEFRGNWKLTELKSFVQSPKNILHEFCLRHVDLYDDKNQKIKSFDITPFISDSPMTRPNTKANTKLSVYKSDTSTQIVVPIVSLIHVKKLELKSCQLILQDKIKASPVELELRNVKFVENGDKVTDFCINDIFDFSRSKKIHIFPSSNGMELDFCSPNALNLDSLELTRGGNINLKNWRSCKWSVKKFKSSFPFIEKTEMKVKEFHFSGFRIDISFLPTSLETLAVNVYNDELISSQSVYLPNLKSLRLDVKAHLSEIISHFVNCPLVELDLSGDRYLTREIKFNSIPRSVKKLKLRDVTVSLQKGDRPLNLDKLVLQEYSFNALKVLLSSHFKTTELEIVSDNADGTQITQD